MLVTFMGFSKTEAQKCDHPGKRTKSFKKKNRLL